MRQSEASKDALKQNITLQGQTVHGHLATISSKAENDFITQLVNATPWETVGNIPQEAYIGLKGDGAIHEWIVGPENDNDQASSFPRSLCQDGE